MPSAPTIRGHRLDALLAPQSVALVGASDRSAWSHRIVGGLETIGFDGRVDLVNPKGGVAHGRLLTRRLDDLDSVPDLAFLMVPSAVVIPAVREAAEAGVRAVVILSSGFAETEAGAETQRELEELCRESGLVVLGPNSLGFVNTSAKVALKPLQRGEELHPGSVAIVSQSGNVTVQLINMARSFDVGLSMAVSTGNEMDVGLADVIDFLIEDTATTSIAVFAESFRDPDGFLDTCRRARDAGKLVTCLKVGRSEAAARAALAHTGSLVGNDAVIDAHLRAAGVVRVGSLEDLLVVTDVFSRTGPIDGDVALLTISGGTCDIVADSAEELGVPLAEFAPETIAELSGILPDFASVHNPLDITGAAIGDATLFGRAMRVVARDPRVGVVVAAQEIDHQAESGDWGREALAEMTRAATDSPRPTVLANTTVRHLSDGVRRIRRDLDVPAVFGGIDRVLPALHQIRRWSREAASAEAGESVTPPITVDASRVGRGTWTEATCRPLLRDVGIDVVPGEIARTPAEAEVAARVLEGPVALKILSDDIVHKSDVGGVELGVEAGRVAEVAATMLRRVAIEAGAASVDGILVSPMRPAGVDLLIGIVREPGWGPVMAIGLGGIWTEILGDVQRLALPATPGQITDALRGLKGWPLLAGARGTVAADLDALVTAVVRIGGLALSLGDELSALEINPLRVNGSRVEALDAAVIWNR